MQTALDWEQRQDGDLYIIRRPISFDHANIDPQGEDCSELQLLACREACREAGKPEDWLFPYSVSSTVGMYIHAQAHGWLRPVMSGVALRCGIMLRGRIGGSGAAGHTSMSGGNGMQFAAHSSHLPAAQQVGWAPMVASFYQDSIIFPPDIAFYPQRDEIPVDPHVLEWLAALERWLASFDHERTDKGKTYGYLQRRDTNHRVTILVNMLIMRGLLPAKYKTNTYDRHVARAVRNIQHTLHTKGATGARCWGPVAHWLVHPT